MRKTIIIFLALFIVIILIIFKKNNKENFRKKSPSLSTLNDLDAILYINLDNREDRKNNFLNQMKKLGVDENKIHRISGVYLPKNGHKGCVQSHIIALKIAELNNWKKVIIMEDDAEILDIDRFETVLKKSFDEIQNINWDVLNLSCFNRKFVNVENKNTIKKLKLCTTSAAYIINNHYYKKLRNLFEMCNNMIDINKNFDYNNEPYALDQQWNKLIEEDNWYWPGENLFKQFSSKSSINS